MQTFTQIWIHLVWTVKNREPLLEKSWRNLLFKRLREISREKSIYLDFVNGVEDHLHVLISLKSSQSLAKVVQELKGISSRWINESGFIEGEFHWQDGYGAFSVSPNQLEMVRNYIRNQEKHHAQHSFEAEWKNIIRKLEE